MKTCTKCGLKKSLKDFYKSKVSRSGYKSECKECHKKGSRKRYESKKRLEEKRATKNCKFCENKVKNDKFDFCSNSCARKFEFQDSTNHPRWRGEEKNDVSIHRWVNRKKGGKPTVCEFCGENPGYGVDGRTKLEWSNISGKYKRDLSDWQCICTKCHRNFDKTGKNRMRDANGRFV